MTSHPPSSAGEAASTLDGQAIVVRNPRTGEVLGDAPVASAADVAAAVTRGRAAQRAWGARSAGERGVLLRSFVRRLRDDPTVVETLLAESGKVRFEAEAIEILYTLELTRFLTGRAGRRALRDEIRRPFLFSHKRARVVYHPRGVVGVIGPWNWPLLNNFGDAIPALAAGNAVVLKPSEITPLTSLHIERLWRASGLPADVFQVVTGRGDTGAALVAAADMIVFTGSVATGCRVGEAAGRRLIPVVLELGGTSVMIVLKDADLERAARAAVWSSFAHSGQVCIRSERVLVEEPVVDRFLELCLAEVSRLRWGPGDENRDVGAMTDPRQIEVCERHVADAIRRGAVVRAGGARLVAPGNWYPPTVLSGCHPEMEVMREETFGPVMPVMAVRDEEHALEVANRSHLGLSGSVWAASNRRASQVARRIESGSVCVNDVLVNYFCIEAPLGGVKRSGLGHRHGLEALRHHCRIETIVEDRLLLGRLTPLVSRLIAFPYQSRVLGWLRVLMRRLY